MRCVAVFVVFILVLLSSQLAKIDAANLTDHELHLEQMYSDLTAKYDSKLAVMDTRMNSVLVTTNAALLTLEKKVEKSNAELISVKSDLQLKSEQLTNVTHALSKTQFIVGFEMRSSTEVPNITDHAELRFADVILNKGNGYNETSGIFNAPVPGNYLFWVNIFNNDQVKRLDIHIRSENSGEVRAFAPDNTYGGVASATALFHLDKGERVWFYKKGSDELFGHDLSSYGGVLLSAD